MYRISIEGTSPEEYVYNPSKNDRDYLITSGTLQQEASKSGTLTFTVPPNNHALTNGYLTRLKPILRLYYKGADNTARIIWKGRIVTDTRDFNGNHTYICEGILAYLNDSVVPPITYGFDELSDGSSSHEIDDGVVDWVDEELISDPDDVQTDGDVGEDDRGLIGDPRNILRYLIKNHNSQVEEEKKIDSVVFTGDWPDDEYTLYVKLPLPNFETTFTYIQNNFISNEEIGGRIWITNSKKLYYRRTTTSTTEADQTIEFGKNLLDFSEQMDMNDFYTVCIPVGKDNLTLAGEGIYDGSIDSISVEAEPLTISTYGRIIRSVQFPEIIDETALRYQAMIALGYHAVPIRKIEISALDLSLLDANVSRFAIGQMVRIKSTPHGVNMLVPCTGITLDLCNPASSKYTFGYTQIAAFTDYRYKIANNTKY